MQVAKAEMQNGLKPNTLSTFILGLKPEAIHKAWIFSKSGVNK
jgi:hypothetical protein